jgi:hypothetical protein
MREIVFGDFENGFDNTVDKHIDILDDDGVPYEPPMIGTEWVAELFYAGHWQVNPAWLEAQEPDEPEVADPPAEPEPVDGQ